jgi:hypothetical protein
MISQGERWTLRKRMGRSGASPHQSIALPPRRAEFFAPPIRGGAHSLTPPFALFARFQRGLKGMPTECCALQALRKFLHAGEST